MGNVKYDLFTIPELSSALRVGFIADLFQGLPHDPNVDRPLAHNFFVKIERVVYHRTFDNHAEYMPYMSYVVFGSLEEVFLSRYMVKFPDFQHIVSLSEFPEWMPPYTPISGSIVTFPDIEGEKQFEKSPFVGRENINVYFQNYPGKLSISIGEDFFIGKVM